MITEDAWKRVIKKIGFDQNTVLRNPSSIRQARPWIQERYHPAQPLKMLSKRVVYDGWANSSNVKFCRSILDDTEGLTMRELFEEVIRACETEKINYFYTWWIYPNKSWERAIYEDANGITFVKLSKLWQLAYPVSVLGSLVGSQGHEGLESFPRNSYFVVYDNESDAIDHKS